MDEHKLYIPYGARLDKEFFLGFGKREGKHCLISGAISILFAVGLYAATLNVFCAVAAAIVGLAISVTIARRAVYSQSIIGVVESAFHFLLEQRTYNFKYAYNFSSDEEGKECQIPVPPPSRRLQKSKQQNQ